MQPINWDGACTLEDYIISLVETKKINSAEFKTLLRIYGRDEIKKIWTDYQKRKKMVVWYLPVKAPFLFERNWLKISAWKKIRLKNQNKKKLALIKDKWVLISWKSMKGKNEWEEK